MPKLLVLDKDYADEFDVQGFAVITDNDFPIWRDKLLAYTHDIEFYFGSNEALFWENGRDLFSYLDILDISDEYANFLAGTFSTANNDLGIIAKFGTGSGVFSLDEIFYA